TTTRCFPFRTGSPGFETGRWSGLRTAARSRSRKDTLMPSDKKIISAKNVKRLYRLGGEDVWALGGVSLDIYSGEYLSIMGPSGSGKSTLFNIIGGLDRPTEGSVMIDGDDIARMDPLQ